MTGSGQPLPARRVPAQRVAHTMPDTSGILDALSEAMSLCGAVAAPMGQASAPKPTVVELADDGPALIPAQRARHVAPTNPQTAGASLSTAPLPHGLRLSAQIKARRDVERPTAPRRITEPVYGSERFYTPGSVAASAARKAAERGRRRRWPLYRVFAMWLVLGVVGGHQRYVNRRWLAGAYVVAAVICGYYLLQGNEFPARLYTVALVIDGALLPWTAPRDRV